MKSSKKYGARAELAGLPDEPVEGDGTSKPDTFRRAAAIAFGDPGPEPAEEA